MTIAKTGVDLLASAILRGRLWATAEETAAWLKTERGQLIHTLILEEERRAADEQTAAAGG